MKKIIFVGLIITILFPVQIIRAQTDRLDLSITEIIKAFDSKDSAMINQYVHPDYGVFILFRMGIIDQYKEVDKLDFDKPVPGYLPYSDFKIDLNIRFQKLPKFDCGSEEWSKQGLYCDTTKIDNLLSQTEINLKEFIGKEISEDVVSRLKDIESRSYRVVLADSDGGELIFYVTLIDGRWYFTILDRVSSDCSA